jgi:O-antigen/teichoic acid export membrane protein
MFAANVVYQFMVINSAYTVLTTPYSGLLFSREKIVFPSLVAIAHVAINLAIAFLLMYSSADKLILYSALLMVLSFANRTILKEYCKRTDPLLKSKNGLPSVNQEMNKNLLAFSGWNLLGSIGIIAQRQGTIFLVNIFFGVVVNAALGIATVVGNQLSNLSSSLLSAVQPQIFKSFGQEDKMKQEFLTLVSSKMGIILLSFALIPLLVQVDYILSIWLVKVPQYASVFIRLYLVLTIMGHMSYGLTIAMQAHGRIKELQITTFSLQILNIPLAYIFYSLGFAVYSIFVITIVLEFMIFIARLYFAKRFINLNIMKYVKNVIFKPSLMIICALGLNILIARCLEPSLKRLLLLISENAIFIMLFSYTVILNKEEKLLIKNIKNSVLTKNLRIIQSS